MRKKLMIIGVCALALSACATTPPPTPVTASGAVRIQGAATIAEFGSWEWQLAPKISRAKVLAQRTARDLGAGRITVGTARAVDAAIARAEASLKAAQRGKKEAPSPENVAALAEARRALDIAQSLLEE